MTSPTTVLSPKLTVTAELVDDLIRRGGYTHPLFNPVPGRTIGDEGPPLPGQAVLLLAGGLVEQSGALNHAKALLELKSVHFTSMVRSGSVLQVEIVPGARRRTTSGKAICDYRWLVTNESGESVLEASAVMMMNNDEEA